MIKVFRLLMIVGCGAMFVACGQQEPVKTEAPAEEKAIAEQATLDTPTPPNVLLIIGDDHGWPYYGFLGDENVVTPHLDRIAGDGMLFGLSHVTSNHCRPTLQTLLTGLYPSQYEARVGKMTEAKLADDAAYQAAEGRERFARMRVAETSLVTEFATLPKLLAEKGYVSFQGGKWWEQSYREGGFTHGMSVGWDWQVMMQDDGFYQFMGGAGIELGRTTMAPLQEFIDANSHQPFFIWYGPSLPHTPLNPPAEHRAHYEAGDFSESAKDYYGNITWFDHGIGELIGMLEDKGVLDNTLIVYVNDNGWEQPPYVEYKDDHDLYSNGGTRGKSSLFDTAFRTPIIFTLQGTIEPGRNDQRLVSATDIVPTILDYVGVSAPDGLPGRSLKPVMEGGEAPSREYLIGYTTSHRGDSDYLGNPTGPSGDVMGRPVEAYYLRSSRWHFVWLQDTGEMALYDMLADPTSQNNVITDHPELIEPFKTEINAWKAVYVDGEAD